MIISFRGTDESINNADAALALYAGMNAIKYNKKTFVLQFMTTNPVEDVMNGKERKERQFGEERSFNDSGMDALLLRSARQRISEDIIQATCESMLSQTGLLMVAEVSRIKNDEFERDCLAKQEDIGVLIARIQELYDDVFILLDGTNHELLEVLSAHVDEEFICVPQGNNEPYASTAKKSTFMIMDFDPASAYNAKHMEKLYNVKNVALCPYNVRFKDALNTSSVLSFVIKNSKPSAYDDNVFFINCVFDIFKVIIGQDILETEEMYFPHMEAKYNGYDEYDKKDNFDERRTLTHKNIIYDDDENSGFFGKMFGRKKRSAYEIVTDNGEIERDEELISVDDMDEDEQYEYEDEPYSERGLDDFDESDIENYTDESYIDEYADETDDFIEDEEFVPEEDVAPVKKRSRRAEDEPEEQEEFDEDIEEINDEEDEEIIEEDIEEEEPIPEKKQSSNNRKKKKREEREVEEEEEFDLVPVDDEEYEEEDEEYYEEEEGSLPDYEDMRPRELYDECVRRGIKVPKRKPARFYIRKLEKKDEDETWED